MVLGCVFLGVKVIEYADKFEHHHVPGANFIWARARRTRPAGRHAAPSSELSLTPAQLQNTTQIYFSLYFTMTGLHALHMIIGVGLMLVITWMAWKGKFDARVLHAGRDERPLLALRRHRLDFPVPAALPGREASLVAVSNVRTRFTSQALHHDLRGADGAHRASRSAPRSSTWARSTSRRDGDRQLQGLAGGAGTSCTSAGPRA